jgi:hypothetical protein
MATFESINEAIQDKLQSILSNGLDATLALRSIMGERIFEQGKNAQGVEVQSVRPYSTKEAYFSQDSLPKKVVTGGKPKEGQTVGKAIESAYFPQGYSAMKQAVGRPPLELFGRLKSDFLNTPIKEESDNVYAIVLNSTNAKQIEGLEQSNTPAYGAIFKPTESEQERFLEILNTTE